MNVVLIVVDALRPDHLGINGYTRNTSPNIDKLSKEGTSFINSYCALPRTNPSMVSIFTGLYPYNHGVRLVYGNPANSSITTLAEILQNHGYKTASMSGGAAYHPLVDKGFQEVNLLTWKIRNKIQRILNRFLNQKNAPLQYGKIAAQWIKKNSSKQFFLCFHPIYLHWPYQIPYPFDNLYDTDYCGNHDFNTLYNRKYSRGDIIFGNVKLSDEEINHAVAHYDGGINYIDKQIGEILNALHDGGIEEETLVILTSDHGENFGEHNFFFQHGASLYETSLKVPLIFKNPKRIPVNKQISGRVRNMDIMPTVLDILNIPLIDEIDGKSLLPLIESKKEELGEIIFAESIEEHFHGNKRVFMRGIKGKWRMLIEGKWKIIFIPHPQNDIFELYNITNDPDEKNNLIDKEKEIALYMKKKILDFLSQQSNEGDADSSDLTEKSKKLLIKLGYLEKE